MVLEAGRPGSRHRQPGRRAALGTGNLPAVSTCGCPLAAQRQPHRIGRPRDETPGIVRGGLGPYARVHFRMGDRLREMNPAPGCKTRLSQSLTEFLRRKPKRDGWSSDATGG